MTGMLLLMFSTLYIGMSVIERNDKEKKSEDEE